MANFFLHASEFQVKFKVLAITLKALHSIGPGYTLDHFSQTLSTCSTGSDRIGTLRLTLP